MRDAVNGHLTRQVCFLVEKTLQVFYWPHSCGMSRVNIQICGNYSTCIGTMDSFVLRTQALQPCDLSMIVHSIYYACL